MVRTRGKQLIVCWHRCFADVSSSRLVRAALTTLTALCSPSHLHGLVTWLGQEHLCHAWHHHSGACLALALAM